ncbi:MAG: aldo/keto reductase [Cytophagaceae bacterium]|jgi:aryl-alcohol dehydrogenase-like predicted oxidoreductase|nr:aldo/keto reductase [Cytophagaceae bacterium]
MKRRRFGKTGWQVSGIGYGMWGMAGWKGSDRAATDHALDVSVELGCNFFDTAWAYGDGLSEEMLGDLIKRHAGKRLYAATKIPPKNRRWPSRPEYLLKDVFPSSYIREYTEMSLRNLKTDCIDLQQFHVWEDSWHSNDDWKEAVTRLKQEGKIAHVGISVNRWEPENVIQTLRTGLIDSVQVIYNIFDQNPEDALFPVCKELDIAVIARVPFDEGTLTGKLTKDTTFPEGDWRNTYFVPENLIPSVERADQLKPLVPDGMDMAEMALRFILNNGVVSTTIPGMRSPSHVAANCNAGDGVALSQALYQELRRHRWDRIPTSWSQ